MLEHRFKRASEKSISRARWKWINGDELADVKCPICNHMIDGSDELDISRKLRMHLAETHRMSELANLGPDEAQRMEVARTAAESRPMPEPGEMTGTTGELGLTERKPDYVLCPFCNSEVRGGDADTLSENLRHHWVDSHQIKPTLMAELGLRR